MDPIVRRHSSLFGHVARLPEDTPAHQALRCHTDLSLGSLPGLSWRRCPGRPRNRWLEQLSRDNSTPAADIWRWAITRDTWGWRYGPWWIRVNDIIATIWFRDV